MTDYVNPEASSWRPVSALGAARLVAGLELTRLVRGKSLRAAVAVVGVLIIAATVSCFLGEGDSRATMVGTVRRLFPWLAMGLSLVFAARTVSDDVESGVMSYLQLLPTRRWAVTLGKYLCAAGAVTVLLVGGTLLLYAGTHLAEPRLFAAHLGDLGRACGAMAAAGLAYTAVFLLLGTAVSDLPYLLPLLFVGVVEFGVGAVPVLQVGSLRHQVGVLLESHEPQSTGGMVDSVLHTLGLVTPEIPPWGAVTILAAVFVLAVAGACAVTEGAEYRRGRS
jgi:hypothetical protein